MMDKKKISNERVIEILECFGADPKSWPYDERKESIALIAESRALQKHQYDAQLLDELLDCSETNLMRSGHIKTSSSIVKHIIDQLPDKTIQAQNTMNDKVGTGNFKTNKIRFHFASAASIMMICSIILIMSLQFSNRNTSTQASVVMAKNVDHDIDKWIWQEVDGNTDDQEEELTFIALLDLENSTN